MGPYSSVIFFFENLAQIFCICSKKKEHGCFVEDSMWGGHLTDQTSSRSNVNIPFKEKPGGCSTCDYNCSITFWVHWLLFTIFAFAIAITPLEDSTIYTCLFPVSQRVILFRSYVMKEKVALGLTESMSVTPQSTLITVHRSRIVEVSRHKQQS